MLGIDPKRLIVSEAFVFTLLVCTCCRLPWRWGALLYFACWAAHGISRRRARRRYYDFHFERLAPSDFPQETQEHFRRHTPAVEALGFERLGDYSLLPRPLFAHLRYLIGPDRRVFASIDNFNGVTSVGFFSVLSDGTYVESASIEPAEYPGRSTRMVWYGLPGASAAAIHEHHLAALRRFEDEEGLEALTFAPEDFADVAQYAHRLVNQWSYEQGRKSEPPPKATLKRIPRRRSLELVT